MHDLRLMGIGLFLFVAGSFVHAGVGQPLTITESGTYVLSEDISVETPPAIAVNVV